MAKINRSIQSPSIVTHEGAPAKRINVEQQLRRSVLACLLWEDTFYEDGVSISERISQLVTQVPFPTVAALACEARDQQYLRHVPLFLLASAVHNGAKGALVSETLAHVIQRPDELAEFVALYWREKKQPLSAQVKKGLALAFQKFGAYSLAKYNRDEAIKLRDVLFLCHAKPKDEEQAAVWKQLVDGTLPAPDTWEVQLSTGKDKLETWTRLLTEDKLGGLALLRNLRNMQNTGVDEQVIRAAIGRNAFSRVLPFRFLAAAKYAPTLEDALETAMFRAVAEMPRLPGRTILLVDHSGSMNAPLSGKSDLTRFEAGAGLAVLIREICEQAAISAFSTQAYPVPARRGFALRDAVSATCGWGGTYTEIAKQTADKVGYDRLIIITDEQSHEALSNPLPGTKGYVINVAPYKNGIGYGQWTHIDGWSESVVKYIQEIEKGEVGE